MSVNVTAPAGCQGSVVGLLNKRRGTILNSEVRDGYVEVDSEVPLNDMFGFSTDLRSLTQGKGEYSMEYRMHSPAMPQVQQQLMADYARSQGKK
ncbi:elongation factor G, III-V domain-containing protein [Cladochytrium replicatum]|nr:elongation factor G, III-V domain-containing protein [Cladochytrium replicatum]